MANKLLGKIVDLNEVNKDGEDALIKASMEGYVDIVDKLLKGGADPNQTNAYGDTALMLASMKGHVEVVEKLLEEFVNAQGELVDDPVLLTLTGALSDQTPIEGADCIVLRGKVPKPLAAKRADINQDGIVNIFDLAIISKYWQESCTVEY